MNEIIFVVEDAPEGGYNARALNHSIYTQGETAQEIKNNIKEAVLCHFDEKDLPTIVRMHFVRDEVFSIA